MPPNTCNDALKSSSIPADSKVETHSPRTDSTEGKLPPLSHSEFRKYNRMAEHMDHFHTQFRHSWKLLNASPSTLSPPNFIRTGLLFAHNLGFHHQIEEQHVFPKLATRMPSFRPEVHLLQQHEKIHEGLEKFVEYLEECKRGDRELSYEEAKKIMDEFGEVLWTHMDDEVRELGAENMRKFWTLEEVGKIML